MTGTASRGDESGVTYSGYTVFAGELDYDGGDPECGYKVHAHRPVSTSQAVTR